MTASKFCPDEVYEAFFNNIAISTSLVIASGSSSGSDMRYNNIALVSGSLLASASLVSGSGNGYFTTTSSSATGRKLTVTAIPSIPILASGTATYVGLVNWSAGSVIKYLTTCTSQALTAGGTVDCPSFDITIQAPT